MYNRGEELEKKRNDIIMACLSGGQHIDAALEAADRLVPQSMIDKAKAEDKRIAEEWLEVQKKRMMDDVFREKTSQPWYVSAVSKWLPF